MRPSIFACLCLFLAARVFGTEVFAPEPKTGPPTINTAYPLDGHPAVNIGKLTVEGAGEVTLVANREGGRLLIKALDGGGAQIGRAETVVGIGDTSIHVKSTRGLFKIVIHWKT